MLSSWGQAWCTAFTEGTGPLIVAVLVSKPAEERVQRPAERQQPIGTRQAVTHLNVCRVQRHVRANRGTRLAREQRRRDLRVAQKAALPEGDGELVGEVSEVEEVVCRTRRVRRTNVRPVE